MISSLYSQHFKDSLVKLHQGRRSLKSLAEEFGPSKDSIVIYVQQATTVMINGKTKKLKDVELPLINQCLEQEYALVHILSVLKIKFSNLL